MFKHIKNMHILKLTAAIGFSNAGARSNSINLYSGQIVTSFDLLTQTK